MDYPSNFIYNSDDKTLSWDACYEGDSYEIRYSINVPQPVWHIIYNGPDTSCSFDVGSGSFVASGRRTTKPGLPVWSPPEVVVVS
ncbi:MAG: hypothetical protein NT007_13990 [Candidatus Kapabacteria bacterium]|nr:hypothetical protein [Candidatus Kapabacteria bacterium]